MPLVLNGTTGVQDNSGAFVRGTSVSASGTSVDFTSIPSWVKRVTVMFDAVSTNGTSIIQVQLGDSGGIENTGYTSTGGFIQPSPTFAGAANSTTGFPIQSGTPAATLSFCGSMIITNLNGNTWTYMSIITGQAATAAMLFGTGSKTLSAILDRVRITTVNGTDTFDAGSINILYE
jgi:hypothetical protein